MADGTVSGTKVITMARRTVVGIARGPAPATPQMAVVALKYAGRGPSNVLVATDDCHLGPALARGSRRQRVTARATIG
jgi:hypothetical protein